MRADAGAALQHHRQQARHGLVIMVARPARPLLAIEPRQTLLEEPLAPVPGAGSRARPRARSRYLSARRRGQHDARSAHQALRCAPRPHQIAQARSLGPGQLDLLLAPPCSSCCRESACLRAVHSARYFWDTALAGC